MILVVFLASTLDQQQEPLVDAPNTLAPVLWVSLG